MIKIDFSRKANRISLEMKGHAGYNAGGGADIVCAAVSGIFYALLGFLANEESGLSVGSIASGDVEIECAEGYESAMKQAYIGFLQIAMSYPGTAVVSESVWGARAPCQTRQAV